MAQKVFVSPGVYTTESELSFVAQSVGVTTLGVAGETLKGPAFEPIFITNYDEFQTYFGTTSPEKFVNTQIPKYELAYIAKAYLQQSNQLFVTRVLGLSGYDAGPSWSILSVANVNSSTVTPDVAMGKISFTLGYSGNTSGEINFTGGTFFGTPMSTVSASTYTKFNGSTSSIQSDIKEFLLTVAADEPALSPNTLYQWGPISGVNYTTYTNFTNVFDVTSLDLSAITYTSRLNDAWYYSLFNIPDPNSAPDTYTGSSFYVKINSMVVNGSTFNGVIGGEFMGFDGISYTGYNNLILATLRSRGVSEFNSTSNGTQFQVNNTSNVSISVSGAYSGTSTNPFGLFLISGTEYDNTTFSFECSLDDANASFISKVLGTGNFQKDRNDVPLFVEERYPTMLNYGYNQGYIRGIKNQLVALESAQSKNTLSIGNYLERYQTAFSPWVVSELRGNTVFQLFRFITISDGSASNRAVKISLANMSFDNDTFDVLVRDYYDTDANPVVIEKYTNCTMDPAQNNYVGVKIGTADGEYQINSKYIMLELNSEAPTDALPCGFEGYLVRSYGTNAPNSKVEYFPIYKTKYYNPGDQISNPPFGSSTGNDDAILSNGENVRRTYLGFSSTIGWDESFFEYKGKQTPSAPFECTEQTYNNWTKLTKGFHMDSGASVVSISSIYTTSGLPAFECGVASFSAEPLSPNDPYYRTYSRKFTLLCGGGFDGWDIYREYRTNSDEYQLGKSGYLYGSLSGCPSYPNATGWGAFRQITVEDDTANWANTDYYAYKLGIASFSNPGIININVFATPGIDYINNYQLVKAAVDMIEIDRADSIYVTTTPDFDVLQPSVSMDNFIYPQDAVDNLASADLDSNYTSTYYPWVLTRETVTNTQVYIPPTAEVCRNLALTDNISFPWFATAGYTRGIVNAVRARRRLTQLDRDTLYQGRINPIATFNDVGTVIWGNKTMQVRESPLDRLNVRRLLLQARKLISAVAIRLLFEQNDAVVRQQFLDSVNPILDAIRRDRGIYDFRVTVDSSPAALDSNQMSGKIFIKPTKALEFIDIEFIVTPQGASFENI